MKSKILIGAAALLFFSCNPANKNPIDPVKTDSVRNSIDTVKAPTDAQLHNIPENVKQIKEEYFDITVDSKGAPEEINSGTSYRAVYDKKGNILEEGYYDARDSVMAKWTFQYDSSGTKINSIEYHKEEMAFKGFFTYDNKNNLVTENYYLPDGRLSYSITNKYDTKKNKIESLILVTNSAAGVKAPGRNTFSFDDQHHVLSHEFYASDGQLSLVDVQKYDSKGNPVENTRTNPDDNSSTSIFYKYEFDEKGNWIKKTEFKKYDSVEKSLKSTVRHIEY